MSKNRNYSSYYKSPQTEEPKNEVEEVRTVEEVTEQPEVVHETLKEETKEAIKQYAIVSGAKRVNLRKASHKDATILTVLNEGERVEVIEEANPTWSHVHYKDYDGFMMTMFLRPED